MLSSLSLGSHAHVHHILPAARFSSLGTGHRIPDYTSCFVSIFYLLSLFPLILFLFGLVYVYLYNYLHMGIPIWLVGPRGRPDAPPIRASVVNAPCRALAE